MQFEYWIYIIVWVNIRWAKNPTKVISAQIIFSTQIKISYTYLENLIFNARRKKLLYFSKKSHPAPEKTNFPNENNFL